MAVSLIRTLILYIAVIIALRLTGKRQIGELEPTELVVTILISDLAAVPMQDTGIPLSAGLVPIATLVCVEIFLSFFCLKSMRLRRLVSGRPCIVIKNGKLDRKMLQDMRVTADEILQELRIHNIDSVSDVKYGIIETNGQLSYVLNNPAKPPTANLMSLQPPDTGIPFLVICDGKLLEENIRKLGKTNTQIANLVKKQNIPRVEDVFVMTLDDSGNLFLQPKEG